MVKLHILNIDALTNVYLVANTPAYLFRHFRNNETVQNFADSHSVAQLASEINRVSALTVPERNIRDIVSAYSSIVGLTFKNPADVLKVLENVEFNRILWGDRILSLWEPYPTYVTTMDVEPSVQTKTGTLKLEITSQAIG